MPASILNIIKALGWRVARSKELRGAKEKIVGENLGIDNLGGLCVSGRGLKGP
jgi:hypothetical protein